MVDEIVSAGGRPIASADSVSTSEGGEAIVQRALDAFGSVDVLINNAGIVRDKSFANLNAEAVSQVLDVHLGGAFNVTRPAYRAMKANGYGRVLFVTSAAGLFGNFGQANYAAAKMGLVGLARTVAIEGARHGRAGQRDRAARPHPDDGRPLRRGDGRLRSRAGRADGRLPRLRASARSRARSSPRAAGGSPARSSESRAAGSPRTLGPTAEDIAENIDVIRADAEYVLPPAPWRKSNSRGPSSDGHSRHRPPACAR